MKKHAWDPDITVDVLTVDMMDWLDELNPDQYHTSPNMVRFRFAGPRVPIDECQRQEGYNIYFKNQDDAVMFKLRWG